MRQVVPQLPAEIPRDGNAVTEWVGKTALRLLRWRIVGEAPPEPKLVIVAGPHTSAWDVVIAFIAKLALRIRVSFLAKHTLFGWPLGQVLRAFGCLPVDRTGPHRLVDDMAGRFASEEQFVLVLAPEGTRRQVDAWKTGFYHIARAADVPVVPVSIDFGQRCLRFGSARRLGDDLEEEVTSLRGFIDAVRARHPELV